MPWTAGPAIVVPAYHRWTRRWASVTLAPPAFAKATAGRLADLSTDAWAEADAAGLTRKNYEGGI